MGARSRAPVGDRSGHHDRRADEGDPLGNVAGGVHRQPGGHQPGAGAEQGGAGLQLHRPADPGRDRDRQGLRDRGLRGVLRVRRGVLRAGQRHQPLRRLPGEDGARAGAVVLDLHHRDGRRHPRPRHGQGDPVGRSGRSARVHRPPPLGYPGPVGARVQGARHQPRLHRGEREGGRLAAGAGPLRRAGGLHQRGGVHRAVDPGSLPASRLGVAQPGRG